MPAPLAISPKRWLPGGALSFPPQDWGEMLIHVWPPSVFSAAAENKPEELLALHGTPGFLGVPITPLLSPYCRCEATISAVPSLTIHTGIHMHSLLYRISWPALPLHNNLIYQCWEGPPLCLWATPLDVEYHYQKPLAPSASYANCWALWSPSLRKCPARRTFVILRRRTLRRHRDWTKLKAAPSWCQPRPTLTPSGISRNYN